MAGPSENAELRLAHEALARRVVEERLAFADRVQEVLEQAHHLQAELDARSEELRELRRLREKQDAHADAAAADAVALRARVEELHADLVEAHDAHRALEHSRSYRYTSPLRGLGKALRRR